MRWIVMMLTFVPVFMGKSQQQEVRGPVEIFGTVYERVDPGRPFTEAPRKAEDWAQPQPIRAEKSAGFVPFTRPEPQDIKPWSRPKPEERITELHPYAALGESELVWFAIRALQPLERVAVSVYAPQAIVWGGTAIVTEMRRAYPFAITLAITIPLAIIAYFVIRHFLKNKTLADWGEKITRREFLRRVGVAIGGFYVGFGLVNKNGARINPRSGSKVERLVGHIKEEIPYRWTSCPINGGTYLNGIVVDKEHPNVLYAYSNIAGIFKSVDYGDSWQVKNRGLVEVGTKDSVATLAIHPQDSDVLYIGCGCNWSSEAPNPEPGGIYITRDGGENWQLLSREVIFCGHGYTGQEGNVLVIDEKNPDIMYAGSAYNGVFKSADGGNTWEYKGLKNNFITTVLLTKDASTIYVACARAYEGKPYESKGGIYRSKDRGESWETLIENLNVQALAIDAKGVLYAACWDKGVYKSEDGGRTWHQKSKGLFKYGNKSFKAIAVDPKNPLILYTTSSEEDYRGITRFTNLYKTVDGGENWEKIPQDIDECCFAKESEYCYAPAVNWWGFYPNKDSIEIDPQNSRRVYYASGFGIWRSEDGGKTWHAKSKNLETADCRCVALHPKIPHFLYAGYGERGLFKSHDGGKTMRYCGSGWTGGAIALDATTPQLVIYHRIIDGRIQKSEDEGLHWRDLPLPSPSIYFSLSPLNPNILYVSTKDGFYQSEDGGQTYHLLSKFNPNRFVIDPQNPEIIYARVFGEEIPGKPFVENEFYRSVDGGKKFEKIGEGYPSYDHPWSGAPLAIDPNNSEVLYIGTVEGVWRSQDRGESWERVLGGVFCKAIAVSNDSAVYVTNSAHLWTGIKPLGIYKSEDRGESWFRLSMEDYAADLDFTGIVLDPFHKGRIYVQGGGNGLFMAEPKP